MGVYFQPVDQNLSTNSCRDINSLFGHDEKEYKRIISYIIEEKLKGHNFISSSTAGLRYLYHWPKLEKINCLLNLVSLIIEPDGKISVCSCFPNYEKYLVSVNGNLKKTFDSLSLSYPCNRCWGGSTTEFNLLGNFGLGTILGMYKRLWLIYYFLGRNLRIWYSYNCELLINAITYHAINRRGKDD